jgi:aerobic-type carbon monoxide dehydrogenase small subunit (CoxS/CutS family)
MKRTTEVRVNGVNRAIDADPERTLLSVLRDDLDLTGTKYGCGEGQCGACTVLIDGNPARSCLTRIGSVAEKEVTTIEGLERNGRLHPLPGCFSGGWSHAVRLLHLGDDHGCGRAAAPESQA